MVNGRQSSHASSSVERLEVAGLRTGCRGSCSIMDSEDDALLIYIVEGLLDLLQITEGCCCFAAHVRTRLLRCCVKTWKSLDVLSSPPSAR